jgi:hypothetical protein
MSNIDKSVETDMTEHAPDKSVEKWWLFKKGHPQYPPRRSLNGHPTRVFTRRAAKILRAIIEERGGELEFTQMIHAQNAADLGASIMEMKDRQKAGKSFDEIAHATLVNRQRQELEAMNE